MKITMYELLGMVKDGKAPKKIKYHDNIYFADYGNWYRYYDEKGNRHDFLNVLYEDFSNLNDTVEILEEEKKIPEKIPLNYADDRKPEEVYEYLRCSYNQLIDYLKSKGDE